ncbi:MAG TPA: hypothetical protein VN229_03365 [Terriglobales bacterium]|nr:hypothetical protein [Terriglobales bacterium]
MTEPVAASYSAPTSLNRDVTVYALATCMLVTEVLADATDSVIVPYVIGPGTGGRMLTGLSS